MVLKLNLESILRKEPSERTPVELTFAAARLMDVELLGSWKRALGADDAGDRALARGP